MNQGTPQITVNSSFVNLAQALRGQGLDASSLLRKVRLINNNAQSVYIHLTGTAFTAPAIAGNTGIPIGQGEASIERYYDVLDANTCWLYAASPTVIIAEIQGAG